MYLEFHGAAGEVTGSLHRVHVGGHDVLLDCGLFQGRRAEADRRNREVPTWARQAHALVVSHAHLDHTGNIPSLTKAGFDGNIYATPCTRDLCSVMLRDAAMIQEQDAKWLNRKHEREGIAGTVTPLYSVDDAQRSIAQIVSIPLKRPMPIAPGVTLTLFDAGHVLGSALVQLDLEERGKRVRLLYTGDLGRGELPLLPNPEIVSDVDVLLSESTYGDRVHPDFSSTDDRLASIVRETIERGGRVYIPSFALERAQEVLFALERLHERSALPLVPIYIDSPLAISITEIYKLHPDSLAPQVRRRLLDRNDPFCPPGLQYVSDVGASKAIQRSDEPCIIIAGSGMCEGGRIVHHFRNALSDRRHSVVIVGFMAEHTLGRRLVEGRQEVKVLGVPRTVRASVHTLEGLSAHADRPHLLQFVRDTAQAGRLTRVALVHGEPPAQESLRDAIAELGGPEVVVGRPGRRIEL